MYIEPAQLSLDKSTLRTQMRQQILSPVAHAQSSAQIVAHLVQLPAWVHAHTIFVYVSMGNEPHTHDLIRMALSQGKRVAVPLCLPDTATHRSVMGARQITDFAQLTPQRYGILAPSADCPLVPPQQIDLVLAPCVATDVHGNRLGNGKGYYDRFLPQVACPVYCLCHSALVVPSLPVAPHDQRPDCIITDLGAQFA